LVGHVLRRGGGGAGGTVPFAPLDTRPAGVRPAGLLPQFRRGSGGLTERRGPRPPMCNRSSEPGFFPRPAVQGHARGSGFLSTGGNSGRCSPGKAPGGPALPVLNKKKKNNYPPMSGPARAVPGLGAGEPAGDSHRLPAQYPGRPRAGSGKAPRPEPRALGTGHTMAPAGGRIAQPGHSGRRAFGVVRGSRADTQGGDTRGPPVPGCRPEQAPAPYGR